MTKKKFFEKNIAFVIGIILFRILLDLNYSDIVSPYYEYAGFYNDKTLASTVTSWISLIFSLPFVIRIVNDKYPFSKAVFIFLYLFSFIPVTSLIQFIPPTNHFAFWVLSYWYVFIAVYLYVIVYKGIVIKINQNNRYNFIYWIIPVFIIAAILFTSGYYRGFKVSFNLLNVYEQRAQSKSWGIPTVISYLLGASNLILSTFLFYTLSSKKHLLSAIISIIMLLDFGIGGNKIILFTLCIVYIFHFLRGWRAFRLLPFLFSIFLLISMVIFKLSGNYSLVSIVIRRAFYVPAQINYIYYDFFSTHTPDYFSNSFMRHFGTVSEYGRYGSVSSFMGEYYYNREINLNNGLFSDAMMNLGYPGVFIFPFLIVALLVILNSVSKNTSLDAILVLGFLISIALIASSLTSSLLNGGIILLILMLLNWPSTKYNSYENLSPYGRTFKR